VNRDSSASSRPVHQYWEAAGPVKDLPPLVAEGTAALGWQAAAHTALILQSMTFATFPAWLR
jgi:hypothetical protein